MYKSLLGRVPLRFNSSLLFHSLFDAYMEQIFVTFPKHVIMKGCDAWDTTLKNIQYIHRMYGLSNVKRCMHLIGRFSHILMRCNVLLMYAPHNEDLVDVQT